MERNDSGMGFVYECAELVADLFRIGKKNSTFNSNQEQAGERFVIGIFNIFVPDIRTSM